MKQHDSNKSMWDISLGENDGKGYEQYRNKLPEKFKKLYPLRAVISGASGSGKTYVIKRMVFHYYAPILKFVFLFSGTDTTINEFKQAYDKIKPKFVLKTFDNYSEDTVNQLVEIMKDKKLPSMFVFDDLGYKNIMSKQKNTAIDRLYQTGRHYNISVITTAQRYTQLNPSSRMNNSNLVMIFNANQKELKTLYDEHGGHLSKTEFIDRFNKAVDGPHKFFCVDYTEGDFNHRYKDSELNSLCGDLQKDLEKEFNGMSIKKEPKKKITKKKTTGKSVEVVKVDKKGDGMIGHFKINGKVERIPIPFRKNEIKEK